LALFENDFPGAARRQQKYLTTEYGRPCETDDPSRALIFWTRVWTVRFSGKDDSSSAP